MHITINICKIHIVNHNRKGMDDLDIVTKMQVNVPKERVFEAFIDPEQIGGFWFSSSSQRWEEGKSITLRYKEYDAELDVQIERIDLNNMIEFTWGPHPVAIHFEDMGQNTIVTTIEKHFDSTEVEQILGQKEGWVYMLSCLKAYMEHGISIRAAIL
ncbi:Activator of Hsp90 ATPase homolog 1-like protein [Staphylococcus caeli]|uniref:Activator of Hsp90 ATPase homolog 1-like protein n=3 Tax=Staphylococcus caeli TaxID=2201815 RepID=A0A1D4MV05_9STAP|nr:Activator of Hsp90 ATPase homolog 1-like protein [Staphylococcus caeli]SCT24238.1 Activator of Hsp90 ATPase homolog 1-like protein [Staphylococcus caeli]